MTESKHLYEVLGVSANASEDEIRRAFHQAALKCHPDKTDDPEKAEHFKEINAAYEILSDKRKRDLYDTYGDELYYVVEQSGVIDNLAQLLQPRLLGILALIAFFCCVILLLAPLFIALKVDNTVSWIWAIVFIPLWLVIILCLVFFSIGIYTSKKKFFCVCLVISSLALLLLVLFIALKLDDIISWPWAAVLSPLYILSILDIIFLVPFASLRLSEYRKNISKNIACSLCGYPGYICRHSYGYMLRVIFVILLPLRADEIFQATWWIVASPLLLWAVIIVILLVIEKKLMKKNQYEEAEDQSSCATMCLWGTLYSLVFIVCVISLALFVVKLDNADSFNLILAFIPFFILTGSLCCCCCCCSCCCCCWARKAKKEFDEPLDSDDGYQVPRQQEKEVEPEKYEEKHQQTIDDVD